MSDELNELRRRVEQLENDVDHLRHLLLETRQQPLAHAADRRPTLLEAQRAGSYTDIFRARQW